MPLLPRNVIRIALSRRDAYYHAMLAWAVKSEYESLAETCAAFLHPNELSYFRSLDFDRRKRSYLLGRSAVKQALIEYSQCPDPTQVEIAPGIFQHPVVRPGFRDPTGVSISHSERAACAIAYSELHPLS